MVGLLVFTALTTPLPYALLVPGFFVDGPSFAWSGDRLIQALRVPDRAFDQDLAYGITHGPATLLLCILSSDRRSHVAWAGNPKGRTRPSGLPGWHRTRERFHVDALARERERDECFFASG